LLRGAGRQSGKGTAIGGVAAAFDTPATLPLVAGATRDDGRQAANSLMGIAGSATSLAGPALAGVLIFTVGAGWAFMLDRHLRVQRVHLGADQGQPVQVPRKSLRGDLVAGWTEVRART
jgi:MFS family permease